MWYLTTALGLIPIARATSLTKYVFILSACMVFIRADSIGEDSGVVNIHRSDCLILPLDRMTNAGDGLMLGDDAGDVPDHAVPM